MKKELNDAVNNSGVKVNEVFLFREMAKAFNHSGISKCTFVKEVHGQKGMVEFQSKYKTGGNAKVELGDLIIFTFDKKTQELRLCVMQAKYKRNRYRRFLNAEADLFQWELLHSKPSIVSKKFPPNILNFQTDYESITAYGIFYHDNIRRDIDFLYTIPYFFQPYSFPRGTVSNGRRSFNFRCFYGFANPNSICRRGILSKEAISVCTMDGFEGQVLACKVGAPIQRGIPLEGWALSTLRGMESYAETSGVIEELLESYPGDFMDSVSTFEGLFSSLVIVTDSEKAGVFDERFRRGEGGQ